jgi:hypothetical protein
LKRGEQLTVQVGVGVEATALIARMPSGSIGETAARFLDEENPWRVIPDVAALGQERIDFATNKLEATTTRRNRRLGSPTSRVAAQAR